MSELFESSNIERICRNIFQNSYLNDIIYVEYVLKFRKWICFSRIFMHFTTLSFFKCHCQHIFYISFLLILANFEMPFPRDPKTLSMGVLARHQRLEAFAASREDVRCPRIRCRCSVSHGRTLDQISFTKKLGFLLLLLLVLHIIIVLMF